MAETAWGRGIVPSSNKILSILDQDKGKKTYGVDSNRNEGMTPLMTARHGMRDNTLGQCLWRFERRKGSK